MQDVLAAAMPQRAREELRSLRFGLPLSLGFIPEFGPWTFQEYESESPPRKKP